MKENRNMAPLLTVSQLDFCELEELNVLDFGVDNSGAVDCTRLLQLLHETGKRIYYPNGTYLFNGLTLNLSGGVRFESMDHVVIRNNISDMNILQFDDDGHLIGLMQNHLEFHENNIALRCGSLVPPPLSDKRFERRVDMLAYWYNDFGLQCQLLAKTGWIGWHYWTWNHHNCEYNPFLKRVLTKKSDPYDVSRHPLLGFYYGDDPIVLDWQCYWLCEYGVTGVVLVSPFYNNWENADSTAHWMYQLFYHTPNFRNLKYVMGGFVPRKQEKYTQKTLLDLWCQMIEQTYATFDNYYSIEKNGKTYPVLEIWNEDKLVEFLDPKGGCDNTIHFYEDVLEKFRACGLYEVAFFCKNPAAELEAPEIRSFIEKTGILRYKTGYEANYVPEECFYDGTTYPQMVKKFKPEYDVHAIQAIAVALSSHTPHSSEWQCGNQTVEAFQKWIRKAIRHLDRHPDMLRTITCYNVAEWSQGGVGLQPNVKDRFSYMKAMKKALVIRELPSKAQQ